MISKQWSIPQQKNYIICCSW